MVPVFVPVPILVVLLPDVLIEVLPVAEKVVKAPVPGVVAPTDAKLAAPAPEMFQLGSTRTKSPPLALPIVIIPVLLPVPILVALLPEVLILVAPVTVKPPVPCRRPALALTPTNDPDPEQARLPLALVIVQPVEDAPPAISKSPADEITNSFRA